MTLDTFLKHRPRGTSARLAKSLGVSPVLVSQWRTGQRQVPASRCVDIERETGGRVRCEDLRPDVDWNYLRVTGDFEKVSP